MSNWIDFCAFSTRKGMLTIELRAPDGQPMRTPEGRSVTITLSTSSFIRDPWDRDPELSIGQYLDEPAAKKLDMLTEHVIAWSGFTMDGEPLPCTHFSVERILMTNPYIRRQVETAIVSAAIKGLSRPGAA